MEPSESIQSHLSNFSNAIPLCSSEGRLTSKSSKHFLLTILIMVSFDGQSNPLSVKDAFQTVFSQ